MEMQHILDDRRQELNSRNDSVEQAPRRLKNKLACEECRDRKIRCDGRRPVCRSCLRKKLPPERCSYSTHSSADNHVARDDSYIKALESRILELESYQGLNPRIVSAPTPTSAQHAERRSGSRIVAVSHNELINAREGSLLVSRTREGNLFTNNATQNQANAGSGSTQGEEVYGNSPPYLGRASAVGFMEEVIETLKPAEALATKPLNRGTAAAEAPESSPSSWFAGNSRDQDSVVLGVDLVLPPRRTADSLLRSYWTGAHPLLPIIHKSSFSARYERIWSGTPSSPKSNGDESSRQSELVFHFMLNIIFALGCRFISISGQGQLSNDLHSMQPFFDRAMKLMTLDLLEDGSIELVQSLLITVQYIQTLELSNKGWVILGMAIRLAQSIGIYLDTGRESQAKREERRRTWCVCVLLDRVHAMTFGRPSMLNSQHHTMLPQMIDDEYFAMDIDEEDRQQPPGIPCKSAYFTSIVKLSDITAEILRLYYTTTPGRAVGLKPDKDYNSLLQLDAQLESWKLGLPSFLRFSTENQNSDPTNLFVRQAHLLHHRLLYSRILLFRRVVVRMAAESFVQPQKSTATRLEHTLGLGCVETCRLAAQELLEVIHPHIGTWLLPPAWYTVFAIYTAGTVLAVVFITPAFRNALDVHQLTALRHSWELSIDCLKKYQQLNVPSASKCLWNLLKIYKVPESESSSSEHNINDAAPAGAATDIASGAAPNLSLSEDGQCIFPGQDDPRQLEALFLDSTFWADENMDWLVDLSNGA